MILEKEWEHADLRCLVYSMKLREMPSYYCGYVRINSDHPYFEKEYDEIYYEIDVEVHGGLTFSSRQLGDIPSDDDYWWLGFDCCHFDDDFSFEEVIEETESLAQQLDRMLEEDWIFGPVNTLIKGCKDEQ